MPLKQVTEEKCWFVIGAHQAGASERQCAELSGLSKTLTHNIIHNFKKMGSPHPNKLSVHDLLNSNNKRKNSDENLKETPRKRGRPRKPAEEPYFTQSMVREALYEVRKNQKPVYNQDSPLVYPLERLNTPPTDEDAYQVDNLKIANSQQEDQDLPLTPRSNEILDDMDEDWLVDDDTNLLLHVFNLPLTNIKWKQLQDKLDDRHLAKMCSERWEYLKKQLIKDLNTNKVLT